jgi:hypothetical protein
MQPSGLRLTELGPPALEFLIRTLGDGNSLAHALRDSRDFTHGRIYAYLPETVNPSNIVNWEQGLGMPRGASLDVLTRTLADIARPLPGAICISEDTAMRRGEESRARTPVRVIGDEVYHVSRSISQDDIRAAILAAHTSMPTIGVISVFPDDWPDAQAAEIGQQLSDLVDATVAVFADAFDGEGYLILEP